MRKILAAAVMSFTVSLPQMGLAESLADALRSAYKTSNLMVQNQAVLRAADEDAAIALSSLRPVLAYSAQQSWRKAENPLAALPGQSDYVETDAAQHGFTLSQLIYAGGAGKKGVAIAREAVLATRASLVNVEQQVLLSAVSAYVDFRLQSEIVALRQSNTRLITKELRAAKDRFDVGEVTATDVSVAEARLAAASAGLAAAQGALAAARERYKAAVGDYPVSLARLPKAPMLPASLDAARAIAMQNHPSIMQAKHQAAIADLQVEIAQAGYGPTLSAQYGVTQTEDGAVTQTGGLSLQQTFYGGGEQAARYRKALAQKESAAAGVHQAGLSVAENLANAWSGVAVANASIAAGAAQVEAAQKAFDGTREEATLGSRTTLDVLNAEQELLSARATRLEAEASKYVGVYQLLAAMGQLSAEKLNLGIPTYDPEAYYNAVKLAPATSTQGAALDRILSKIAPQ